MAACSKFTDCLRCVAKTCFWVNDKCSNHPPRGNKSFIGPPGIYFILLQFNFSLILFFPFLGIGDKDSDSCPAMECPEPVPVVDHMWTFAAALAIAIVAASFFAIGWFARGYQMEASKKEEPRRPAVALVESPTGGVIGNLRC